jgi:hypothetical protein
LSRKYPEHCTLQTQRLRPLFRCCPTAVDGFADEAGERHDDIDAEQNDFEELCGSSNEFVKSRLVDRRSHYRERAGKRYCVEQIGAHDGQCAFDGERRVARITAPLGATGDREQTALFAGQSSALTQDTTAAAFVESLAAETFRRLRVFST